MMGYRAIVTKLCLLWSAALAAAEPVAIRLFLDPASGVISTEAGPGRLALGSFVPAESAAALEQRLTVLEQRLARMELADTPALASATVVPADAQADAATVAAVSPGPAASGRVDYQRPNFVLTSPDERFSLRIQNRVQLRYQDPFDEDPRSLAALNAEQRAFQIRRSRLRLAGHLYQPWIEYNMQYDWGQPIMRDFFVNLAPSEAAELRVGRGKVIYNDERVTSSGRQQFVNRSIVNDLFTVDRQQGMQLHGRLLRESPADFNYVLGVFTGNGVSSTRNDDSRLMLAGRLQWNALGGPIPFSQSDLDFSPEPMLNIAVAGMRNRSNCTVFATDSNSCRALPGFVAPAQAAPGQFAIEQTLAELRARWQGFSLMGEWHEKSVTDRVLASSDPRRETDLRGGFIQAGWLPHGLLPATPRQLELALRYGKVDMDDPRGSDTQREYTAAVNWFISGHHNKLTLEFGHLTVADPLLQLDGSENRIRLQWDLSF
jgi:phosphate-selective porin OprO/OprP